MSDCPAFCMPCMLHASWPFAVCLHCHFFFQVGAGAYFRMTVTNMLVVNHPFYFVHLCKDMSSIALEHQEQRPWCPTSRVSSRKETAIHGNLEYASAESIEGKGKIQEEGKAAAAVFSIRGYIPMYQTTKNVLYVLGSNSFVMCKAIALALSHEKTPPSP